jgi:catechol 2,3-dioxygenase-like lactoylglutathione lyase family enzyme
MRNQARLQQKDGMSRRDALGVIGLAASGAAFVTSTSGQGRCSKGYGNQACPMTAQAATAPIKPVFEPTGWKTVALEQITFLASNHLKEAAFYVALMGWKFRSEDGKQVVLDIDDWGSAIFRPMPGLRTAVVGSFGFVIEPWDSKTVEAELRKRGLAPVREDDGKGFESFRVKDPDGFDLQISNGRGLTRARKTPASGEISIPLPFESAGWRTVWLDHLSFGVTNYKESASYYNNLLGWKETYDEGSQHELLIGDVGNVIVRGGNPFDPKFQADAARAARIDHVSFGISPWDSDRVKAELDKRGLRARVDTATGEDIHTAPYKSYHTMTPNGYNLQISCIRRESRLDASNAVKPKSTQQ